MKISETGYFLYILFLVWQARSIEYTRNYQQNGVDFYFKTLFDMVLVAPEYMYQ